jgi:AcrR family transcriptional regulator
MALKRLNAEHYVAINELAKPKAERKTIDEIAELAGVSRTSIFNWKNDALFERELKRQIVRNTISDLPDVLASVPKHIIQDGNAAMLKTFLQAHDMLTDRVEVETKTSDGNVDRGELKARLERLRSSEE